MPKTIKEIQQDYTGTTTVEYSDGSTRTYTVDDVPTVSTNPSTGIKQLSADGEVVLVPELKPSGGDDGPRIIAMAVENNGFVRLSKGRFRIETYTELHIEGLGLTGLHLMGAGEGITFIDVPESFPSSLGTPFANWLDAKPALRIFTTSNNVTAITLGGLTMTRIALGGARVTTNSGLAVCFDVPPTYPATGYQPYEPLRLRNIRVEGFDCAFAANDVTNLDAIGLITTNCNSTFATGFNCDIWSFKDCKFGTSLQAVGPTNKPNTPFFINGYYGRGKETLNYTISGGVGTVSTGAPVMVAGVDVYLDATSGPLTDGVRTILSTGTGTFTFSAAGVADGSGVISMGAHSAWGAGNQWLLDSCWFMGTDRLYRSPSATIGYPPAELKLLNCYFEQVWILVESENDARIDFDSCYFVGHTLTWAQTYRSTYDNTKQQWAVFNFQNAGGNSPSSRVKFRKCFGVTYLDGWVQNIGADAQESRSPFIEFDDCSLSFLENSRKLKWFHLSILSNLSSSQGAVYLEQQYQAAVNTGVEAQIRGIGLHRYRGLIRLASSDPAVYQVSSDAAAMVPAIPATLNVIPPQANIYRLEGVDKTVAISEPKVRRVNTDATLDSYATAHLVVNGTSRPRIASLQMPKLSFYITQDATAGRQITWDAAYKFHTAFVQAVTTTDANKTTFVEFEWDGKNWRQSSSANTWL